jgi:carbon storage regulator CsrA
MLVLSRKVDDVIVLDVRGVRVDVMVTKIIASDDRVLIGIRAPAEVAVFRQEIEARTGTWRRPPPPERLPAGVPLEAVRRIRAAFQTEPRPDDGGAWSNAVEAAIDAALAAAP